MMYENGVHEEYESVYIEAQKNHDLHEEDLQKQIRDRGRWASFLGLVLAVSLYGNVTDALQPKQIPALYVVDKHGEVVTRTFVRTKDLAEDDPNRESMTRTFVEKWIGNCRTRSQDHLVTKKGMESCLDTSAGPALNEIRRIVGSGEVWERVKKESVHVDIPKFSMRIPGTKTWQVEWVEEVKPHSGPPRLEHWAGTVRVEEREDWAGFNDALGLRVVEATAKKVER